MPPDSEDTTLPPFRLRVGLKEKVIRSLNRTNMVQRNQINLPSLFCHPLHTLRKEFSVDYYGYQYRGVINNATDWLVYFFDKFIEPEVALLRQVASLSRRQNKPFICYDIGASSGYMTLAMASLADQVIAVDPLSAAYSELRARLSENRISHVKTFRLGLAETRKQGIFKVLSVINLRAKRVQLQHERLALGTFETLMLTGDELVQRNKLDPPSFIRVNAGDDALAILQGFSKTLRTAKPVVMIDPPTMAPTQPLLEGRLRDVLYNNVDLFSFRRTPNETSFELDAFRSNAQRIICMPPDLRKMAEFEWAKLHSARLV